MPTQKTIAFFNKKATPLHELMVPIDDRAYQFGDAIYEVLRVYSGKPFLLADHMARLSASLESMGIFGIKDIREDILENISINNIKEGMVYVQISRGCAPRNHSFYNIELTPNVLIYTKPFFEHPSHADSLSGIFAITDDDLRWGRCDIKSVNLLANCLSISKAHQRGSKEAILIRENYVTEGSSSNVFLVKNNIIATPPLSRHILSGTRRNFLIKELSRMGHDIKERAILKDELYRSDEIFITSAIREAMAIVKIDNRIVSDGQVGKIAKFARSLIIDAAH